MRQPARVTTLAVTLAALPALAVNAAPVDADAPAPSWVFFRDKDLRTPLETMAAWGEAAHHLSPRAVERRRLRGPGADGGPVIDAHDLAVPARYVAAVEATGADLRRTTRWLNAVSVSADRDELAAIAALPFVDHVQPVARTRDPRPGPDRRTPTGLDGFDYGLSNDQLQQINLIALHDAGFTGDGVVIGILDTGFQLIHDAFNQPGHEVEVIGAYDFVDDDDVVGPEPGDPGSQHNHGTYILGTIGSYLPGTIVGGAPDASFVLCKTEDTSDEYQGEEDNYVAGIEFMEGLGADLSTSSLSYYDWYTQDDMDGMTAVTSIALNLAAARGLHSCTAASNRGHDDDPATNHLGAPADALYVITCGAVEITGEIAGFSSDGPSADGRVKPEVLALGVGTATVRPDTTDEYSFVSGTSLSTPLVASALACLVQAHPDWSVDTMREALIATGDRALSDGTFDPEYVYGYGLVNAYEAGRDCNDNGIPDIVDILGGAPDENDNGIPDECEVDPCPADVDDDGVVAISDLLAVLAGWGGADVDVTGDGIVDVADLLAVLSAWGAC